MTKKKGRPKTTVEDLPRLLTTAEAAEYLGIATGTLHNWRSADAGPDYVVMGSWVRYAAEDLEEWRESHTVRTRHSSVSRATRR
ncbi:MAG TPA: helix-turn-helix domain-containing protein [Candidatus Nesterenkonia stercoripullorum]|uniref:Helix-turn-helix domain-containing protein n=1 Tax=Candidatus Nesterenkonia stercoripullorum TaxID=2838701 RepID=A0A9D1RYX3_9MICC|nr:helix-turn-helix domain-containing protein [Candidatus Nesterenkonia stercoripullorum]